MQRPLTPFELQFWNLHQFFPIDTAYNIPACFELSGEIEPTRLAQAWDRVVMRSSHLNFTVLGGELPQFVELPLNACAMRILPHMQRSEAYELIQQLLDSAFNLQGEVLLRCRYIPLGPREGIFVLVVHHILVDLHTLEKLMDMLVEEYANSSGNAVAETSPLRGSIPSELPAKQIGFWKKELASPPPPLLLPSARASRTTFDGSGHSLSAKVPPNVSERLAKAEKSGGRQTFLTLLTVYASLLSRLSASQEFYLALPFTNRLSPEKRAFMGPMINVLPLRVSLRSDTTFSDLYMQLRKTMLVLHRNQELPFVEFARWYVWERTMEIPFFLQVGMTQERMIAPQLPELKTKALRMRPRGSQMDLFFTYWEEAGEIAYRWEYNSHAFRREQIEHWMDSYETMLSHMLEHPDQKICEADLVGRRSSSFNYSYYSCNSRPYPLNRSLRQLLINSYQKEPDAIAVQDDERRLSYADFFNRICRGAAYLHHRLGSGKTVAIILDNCIDRVVTVHAIIHSGNRYLPIDPMWPEGRIAYMLEKADTRLVLSDHYAHRVAERFPHESVQNVYDDSNAPQLPEFEVCPKDPIAILFTSGSTGQPKGVIIQGRGIVNRLYWMQEKFPLSLGDALMHKVPYTFDVSIWELIWPFLFQAKLVIPGAGGYLDDRYLSREIERQGITYIHFVPSLLRKFLSEISVKRYATLRGIICSGEALPPALVADTHRQLPGVPVFNLYGPTEASIDVSCWDCTPEDEDEAVLPIGYPIANTRIYILDEHSKLCAPYVRGEIALAGVQLATGYINAPDLTAQRFVFGDWGFGEERVYLTGDVGYYTHDNCVFYNGRNDSQVKINGVRIELGEIERALESLPQVRKAAVMVHHGLIAFLLGDDRLPIREVRRVLAKDLPGYMIPDRFKWRSSFPINTNGKTDRNALLANLSEAGSTETDEEALGNEANVDRFEGAQDDSATGSQISVSRLYLTRRSQMRFRRLMRRRSIG